MRLAEFVMHSDLRFALRQIAREPRSAVVAMLVLALGLGAATAVFSVLYQILLKPLPYRDADRIVFLHNSFPKEQLALAGVSSFDYVEIRRHKQLFSEAGVYYFNDLTMTGAGVARHVDPVNVSASFFRVLDVKPALGRVINEADDRFGAPKVAVLSDGFWRSAFQRNPNVLGRSIQLDGEAYTIIGVMPRAFEFPYPATQLWLPVAFRPAELSGMGRLDKWLHMIARLAPGVTAAQAQAGLQTVGHGLAEHFPAFYPEKTGWHFALKPIRQEQTEGIRVWLLLAFGAVFCVFLVACANASGLLLIRWSARSNELAVRAALGAGQRRIVRQILTETLLLAAGGCGAGVLLALWAVRLSNRFSPVGHGAQIETWTILFALGMALLSTFAAGLAPAWAGAKVPLEQMLKAGATRTATRGSGGRTLFLAGQIAVAVTLLSSATLLSRSFLKLMQVPPGFAPERVWSGSVALPRSWHSGAAANLHFFKQLVDGVRALPDVQSAAGCTAPPFNASGPETLDVFFQARHQFSYQPQAEANGVLPGYFETMKIPLRAGRFFNDRDGTTRERPLIVDEEFARVYFAGENPLGKLVGIGGERDHPGRIVGVVGNVENSQMEGRHKPEIYWPFTEETANAMYLVARTKNDADVTGSVRSVLANQSRDVALYDVASMSERISESLKVRRFLAWLLNGFAAIGLVLAALGLYGSLAHLVQLRRREICVRLALGATRHDILGTVMRQAASVLVAGLFLGVGGAAAAALLIRNRLFQVHFYDPLTWTIILVALAIAAAVAACLPALRALRVQPMDALREE